LGIVRDATLTATNDFIMFSESFETVALRGAADQGMLVDLEVCADGSTSEPVSVNVCPQGS
jgi:hypothetical protein